MRPAWRPSAGQEPSRHGPGQPDSRQGSSRGKAGTVSRHLITPLAFAIFACGLWAVPLAGADAATINACVNKQTGQARIVKAGVTCATTERLVSWNNPGAPGTQGPAGAQGPAGRLRVPDGVRRDGRRPGRQYRR